MTPFRAPALLLALVALPALSGAQTLLGRNDSVFTWRGPLRAGALLTVKNQNGPIDVRPGSGSQVELRAEKRTRHGNETDVAFDVETGSNGDVTICSTLRGNNPCDENRDRRNRDDDGRSVSVAMTLLVPRGAQVRVTTGNGAVSVERVGGEVSASTGNGRVNVLNTDGAVRVSTGNGDVVVREAKGAVRVSTGNGRVNVTTSQGPVEARSGNGDIDVRMAAVRPSEDMTFSTGSGDVRVTLPTGYNGELDASTGNGSIASEFDLKLEGRMSPRRVRATIGSGGARLRLTTGNGGLELKKAQ
jgi:Putative adhesin